MKALLAFFAILFLTFSISASAQTADAIYKRACGPKEASFDVKQIKSQPPAAPEPGKALVYFIQKEYGAKRFITRVGLDGAWVGVIKGDSYVALSVAPGEHRACVNLQNRGIPRENDEFLQIRAEAGKVYYYLVRSINTATGAGAGADILEPGPADRDEALFLIASDSQSVATPKP